MFQLALRHAIGGLGLLAAVLGGVGPTRAGTVDPVFADGYEVRPIVVPAGTWSFVGFDNAVCGNGSSTGIGVNPGPPGGRLLLFLSGGGACWDNTTCIVLQTAANFNTGYGPANFNADLGQLGSGFFDRTAPGNPFRNDSFVFVPYCTGDVHAGDNVVTYGGNVRHHAGYRNMGAYLERLVPTFSSVSRVVLAGASAGGYGATYNWERVQRAFGNLRVDLIDDSGTFMPASIVSPTSTNEQLRATNWNIAATLPPGCTACSNGLDNLFSYYATSLPNHRAALLSYRPDSTLSAFYQISLANFSAGLDQVLLQHFDPFPDRRYFVATGPGHVLFSQPGLVSGGVSVETFITRMVSDDPAWANVTP